LAVAEEVSRKRATEASPQRANGKESGAPTTNAAPAKTATSDVNPAGPEVLALFGSLRPGSTVGRWTVAALHDVHLGGIPVVLSTADGERFQVDVVRRDCSPGAPAGVGNTASLSVFVLNDGDGSKATHEEHGLGAMALAEALNRREAEGAAIPQLLTLAERQSRFPRGVYSVSA